MDGKHFIRSRGKNSVFKFIRINLDGAKIPDFGLNVLNRLSIFFCTSGCWGSRGRNSRRRKSRGWSCSWSCRWKFGRTGKSGIQYDLRKPNYDSKEDKRLEKFPCKCNENYDGKRTSHRADIRRNQPDLWKHFFRAKKGIRLLRRRKVTAGYRIKRFKQMGRWSKEKYRSRARSKEEVWGAAGKVSGIILRFLKFVRLEFDQSIIKMSSTLPKYHMSLKRC